MAPTSPLPSSPVLISLRCACYCSCAHRLGSAQDCERCLSWIDSGLVIRSLNWLKYLASEGCREADAGRSYMPKRSHSSEHHHHHSPHDWHSQEYVSKWAEGQDQKEVNRQEPFRVM